MHRFYLAPERIQGAVITLSGSEAHHALRVLRVRETDQVLVLDGAGHERLCRVENLGRKEVTLAVLKQAAHPPLPCQITLAQAITKPKSMDLIVQKATELGAHRLIPLLAERSISQIDQQAAPGRVEKWRAIAIEAVKQSGAPWLPQIELPQSVARFLAHSEQDQLSLVGSLQSGARHPRVYFEDWLSERRSLPQSVCIWVGPEGDFTAGELDAIQRAGARPISLGRQVLRSETAAIYCLSIVHYELLAAASGA
jgi:16S rRNA (uracil1498-N3)-methyltransferase